MSSVGQGGGRRHGDQLIDRVLRGETDNAEVATALLTELHGGFPVTELRRLLRADADEIVYRGVWLASELGARGRPIFPDVRALLRHPSEKVRYYAIDFHSTNVSAEDWPATDAVIGLMDDSSAAVRYAVMKFLFDVPDEVLRPARDASNAAAPDGQVAIGLSLVLDAVDARDIAAIRCADRRTTNA